MNQYIIWSNKKKAFWRANEAGYTPEKAEAGIYSEDLAVDICLGSNRGPEQHFGSCMVPVQVK